MNKPIPVRNPVKKGEIVALRVTHSTTYAFGSGRGTEVREAYTLAVVNSAARDGSATSLQRRSGHTMQLRRGDYALHDVMTINAERQEAARKVYDALAWGTDELDDIEALKDRIRKETV